MANPATPSTALAPVLPIRGDGDGEGRVVVFLRGHALALRQTLIHRIPIQRAFVPSIHQALANAMGPSGDAFPTLRSVGDLAVRLTQDDMRALVHILQAGRGTMDHPHAPFLIEAFDLAFRFDADAYASRQPGAKAQGASL